MPQLNLNTRAQFDHEYAWETIQQKYFDGSLDQLPPENPVETDIACLRAMIQEAYEIGKLSTRTAQHSAFKSLR